MADPTITTVAGGGTDKSGFGGAAARLDLRQATPGTRELGRNQGVAVGPGGRVYVVSTATNAVGRIEPPSTWHDTDLGEALTTPTGALAWLPYPATVAASVDATTYQGHSAVHWVATGADARTCLYVKFPVVAGSQGHAAVTLVGSGDVCLELYDSGGDRFGSTVSLSATPQTLTLDAPLTDATLQLQVRCRTPQARVEVTMYAASVRMAQRTGDTAPVAGTMHHAGDSGDRGPAVHARLNAPTGIAVDARGRVVLADTYNNRVRAVSPSGRITTLAGTGHAGYDDHGRATRARLDHPSGVAVDRSGNVYLADTYNNRIRRIGTDGRITTIAGTGRAGYAGDGAEATAAQLDHPQGVAVDRNGDVLVADTYNHRLRRIDRTGHITTVAGTGDAGYGGDGGPATTARLNTPYGVAVAPDGVLYVADTLNQRIRRIGGDGSIDTVAGAGGYGTTGRTGGPPIKALLAEPLAVAVDPGSGDVYVVEATEAVLRLTGV